MKRLEGKVAVVTGGNSGIGLAAAQRLQEEGARVAISGRNAKTLEDAVKTIGNGVLAVQSDVANPADLDKLYAAVSKKFGKTKRRRIDHLEHFGGRRNRGRQRHGLCRYEGRIAVVHKVDRRGISGPWDSRQCGKSRAYQHAGRLRAHRAVERGDGRVREQHPEPGPDEAHRSAPRNSRDSGLSGVIRRFVHYRGGDSRRRWVRTNLKRGEARHPSAQIPRLANFRLRKDRQC